MACRALPASRCQHAEQGGFTLIELLVVIVIAGVLASVVTFYVDPHSASREVDQETDRLLSDLDLASDQAMAENHELGLKLENGNTYRFLIFNDATQVWQPYDDEAFKAHTLPEGLQLHLVTENRTLLPRSDAARAASKLEPDVLLLSSGEASKAIIELSADADLSASERVLIDEMATFKKETSKNGA